MKMENNLTQLDDYIILLHTIIGKLNDHFLEYEYDKKIIDRFITYSNSGYRHLFELYPIHFMQIAFYDKYIEHGYNCLEIMNFTQYFYPYQQKCYNHYWRMLQILYNLVKGYNDISEITFDLDNLCL